jgi:hypothetical protein
MVEAERGKAGEEGGISTPEKESGNTAETLAG